MVSNSLFPDGAANAACLGWKLRCGSRNRPEHSSGREAGRSEAMGFKVDEIFSPTIRASTMSSGCVPVTVPFHSIPR